VSYTVVFKPSAENDFEKLPPQVQERIGASLASLESTPRPAGCKKLKAREGYRVRVGDYRIVYSIDDRASVVRILAIGHRKEIYQ